ncbi:rod shape-determining protein MreC [Spirosomataceae bacterium TFI 002]|nr:rod shape-determining protein MreC [Spirosomataceae bacterium TFI 002]
MSQLFGLIFKARNLLLFLLLEIVCFYLIRKNNIKWDVSLFNSSNRIAASTMAATYNAQEYIYLKKTNEELASENIKLREELTSLRELKVDSNEINNPYAHRFGYITAKVANNTVGLSKNYLTINKGKLDGIKPGMGVIGPAGVVGQVMSCSDHFSRVISILNVDFNISSEVVNQNLKDENIIALGVSNWNSVSHRYIDLKTIDKFKKVKIGDSVVTSNQNLIFPSQIMVGKIAKVKDLPQSAFWDIEVELSSDFTGLRYVYVIENKLTSEQLTLEEIEDEQ